MHDLDLRSLLEDTPSEQIHCWMKASGKDTADEKDTLQSFPIDDVDTALILARSGASLYFRAPQQLTDEIVVAFQHGIASGFAGGAANGEVETFVSKAGHVTDWHFDFMDNFTLQLSGSKRWRLRRGPPSPLRGCTPHYNEHPSTVEMQARIHKLRGKNQSQPFKRFAETPMMGNV